MMIHTYVFIDHNLAFVILHVYGIFYFVVICANLIIVNNQTIEDLQDKLKKSENRCACEEGKLKKIRVKQYAMNVAINLYNHYPTSLKEHFDNVIDLLSL